MSKYSVSKLAKLKLDRTNTTPITCGHEDITQPLDVNTAVFYTFIVMKNLEENG